MFWNKALKAREKVKFSKGRVAILFVLGLRHVLASNCFLHYIRINKIYIYTCICMYTYAYASRYIHICIYIHILFC